MNSNRAMTFVVPALTALVGFSLGAIYMYGSSQDDEPVLPVIAEECAPTQIIQTPIPSPHIANAVRLIAAADHSNPSLWIEQELLEGGERRHLFFFKEEQPYSMVDVGANIGIVSFLLTEDDRWLPELINGQMFANGTRGVVTPQSYFRFDRVSGDQTLMIVRNSRDTFEGSELYLDLFLYSQGKLVPAGRVFAGANNKEMKCDGPAAKPEAYNRACMDFTGEVSIVPVTGQSIANLEVTFSGLGGEKNPELEKATYRFVQGRFTEE